MVNRTYIQYFLIAVLVTCMTISVYSFYTLSSDVKEYKDKYTEEKLKSDSLNETVDFYKENIDKQKQEIDTLNEKVNKLTIENNRQKDDIAYYKKISGK